MKCPHCGSFFYDGEHCFKCGRGIKIDIPSLKAIREFKCKECGAAFQVYIVYGQGNQNHTNEGDVRYCQECKDRHKYDYNVAYRTDRDLTKMSKKRRKQYLNYLEYIGEITQLKREIKGRVTQRAV